MDQIAKQLLVITRQFLAEMKAQRAADAVSLNAVLDKELGIGSLEKAELLSRIEKNFGVTLSEQSLAKSQTLNDLLSAIQEAKPTVTFSSGQFMPQMQAAGVDPTSAETLTALLKQYADSEPERAHIYFQDDLGNETTLTYGALYKQASAVAAGLIATGIKPTDTVSIMLPTGFDFFIAFCGVLLAGAIPVPIYPPFRPDQVEDYIKREAGILHNAEVRCLITFKQASGVSRLLQAFIPSLKTVTTVSALSQGHDSIDPQIMLASDDSALIQYTSGSTGNPKGVLLTHQNLLSNIRAYGQAIDIKPTDVCVSWLPLYHDMGLIGAWLGSFYHGIPLSLMSPLTFLTHPARWLWALHYHRGSLAASPNFGYELCIRKVDDNDIQGLDLSAWRVAANGAEAVNPSTLDRFYEKFAKYGLKKEALYPVYGLAESTVGLTLPPLGQAYQLDTIDRELFETKKKAVPVDANDGKKTFQFVACGKPLAGHEIRIVDADGSVLGERELGQLQFRGPSAMQGYYRNPKATEAIYHDGWFDTGDYGYIAQGSLYLTGRQKDIIIKAGRNFHPDDIETAAGSVEGVRKGCVAAFGVKDDSKGTEQFVIVAETQETAPAIKKAMISEIIEKAMAAVGVPPDEVVLVAPKTIQKTSSGKLRRASCKQAYVAGKLSVRRKPLWRQVGKLFFMTALKKIKTFFSSSIRFLYTLFVGLLVVLHSPFFLLSLFLSPQRLARKFARFWVRWLFACVFCPIKVEGKANLYAHQPMVFVANHASYVDALVLIATLPADTTFIGKKELLNMPVLKYFLKKLGHTTVDRYDFMKSQSDVGTLYQTIQSGRSIGLFPEGTFTYATGLRPFKLGAFKVAVDAQVPVCPVTLIGTRKFLRADSWLLRPSAIKAIVAKPVSPSGNSWDAINALQQVVRNKMIENSDEKAINLIAANIAGQ